MKKSIISVFLLSCMILALAACGGSDTAESTPSPEPTSEPSGILETEAPEKTPSAPAETESEDSSEPQLYGVKDYAEYYEPWLSELKSGLPELPDIDIHSWEFILANSYNSVAQYEITSYASIEGQGIDSKIEDATNNFLADARAAGYPLYLATAARNLEFNVNNYLLAVRETGSAEEAAKKFLPPGCNEHQLGLGIDLTDDYNHSAFFATFDNLDFLDSDSYKWALEHCTDYGFINRYPEGKEEFYGYPCQTAGHFRYVGVEAAKYITENNLCLEEFISLYDPSLVYIPSKISD